MNCHDCPDLNNDIERPTDPNWKPRATCCRDDHIERRKAGDPRPWEGTDDARTRQFDPNLAVPIDINADWLNIPDPSKPNRRARRATAAKNRG